MGAINFDSLSNDMAGRAQHAGLKLNGPVSTEYGFGWSPTITFWKNERRVHFYDALDLDDEGFAVEVAHAGEKAEVRCGLIQTCDQAWNVIDNFLLKECDIKELPDYQWNPITKSHDKFIPHPPDKPNPANIPGL